MVVGGCFCGKVRVELNGQPITSGLCYCLDCRKITGSSHSYSFVVKSAEFDIFGSPKEVSKTSDSGNHIKNYFCSDCGTPMFGRKTKPNGDPDDITVVRAGIFDDVEILNGRKPEAELYTDRRLTWIPPLEGAGQFCGMVPMPDMAG